MKRSIAGLAALLFVTSWASAQVPEGGTGAAATRIPSGISGLERPADFGTSLFYSAIDSYSMSPNSAGFLAIRSSTTGNFFCAAGSTDSRAVGQILLPHGVDIDVVRVWGSDQSAAADMQVRLLSSCLPDFAPDVPTLTTITTITSAGSPSAFSDFNNIPGTTLVDNQSCTYRVEARLGPDDATCSAGLFFSKLRVGWRRAIPPAPAVASFTDVPTGAQFFAEVEALADTGITAGCTATEFCPENPVTRRQMAAFLARALGLPPATIVDPANP